MNIALSIMMVFYCASVLASPWPTGGKDTSNTTNFSADLGGCASFNNQSALKGVKFNGITLQDAETPFFTGLLKTTFDLEKKFTVIPAIALYDDLAPNALAFSYDVTNLYHEDGAVFLGRNLIEREQKNSIYWGTVLSFILAHEYAHIYQYKKDINISNPSFELHADFLAGWYLGVKNYETDGLFANFQAATEALFEKGEYHFNSTDHHGTPAQRIAAMLSGYLVGLQHLSVDAASSQGLIQVKKISEDK